MNLIKYKKIDDYIIAMDLNTKLFYVCDKEMELYSRRSFKLASQAIDWADKFFKVL